MFKTEKLVFKLCENFQPFKKFNLLPGKKFTSIQKDNFLFLVYYNTSICVINEADISLIQIYAGIDEDIKFIDYTNEFIYILCSDNKLYKTSYDDLEFKVVIEDIRLFCVKNNKLAFLDSKGKIFLDGVLIDTFQFDVKYICIVENDLYIVYNDRIKINNQFIPLNTFKLGYKSYLVDSKGIYNLKQKTYIKIKNVEDLNHEDDKLFIFKDKKWYF